MRIEKIKPVVYSQSLVEILGKPEWPDKPLDFGNYFSFKSNWDLWGLKCVNMWAENLKFLTLVLDLEDIEVTIFGGRDYKSKYDGKIEKEMEFCFITDKRIPKKWLIQDDLYLEDGHPGICITGCGGICKETLNELVEFKKTL